MVPGERFVRLSFCVPRDLQESFCAELWSTGSLGLQILPARSDLDRIDCYFSMLSDPPSSLDESWAGRGVVQISREIVEDRDWLEEYRRNATPILLGRRFVVDVREPRDVREPQSRLSRRVAAGADRVRLRVPARRAFGTGSHESTRLAVALLEELDFAGKRVLDVGSGSGILSFVCLELGARSAVAVDNDVEAILCSSANAALNELDPLLVVATVEAIRNDRLFDVAAVNVLPHLILRQMGSIAALLRSSGSLVYSGALSEQEGEIRGLLEGLALEVVDRRQEGDWIALRAVKGTER